MFRVQQETAPLLGFTSLAWRHALDLAVDDRDAADPLTWQLLSSTLFGAGQYRRAKVGWLGYGGFF